MRSDDVGGPEVLTYEGMMRRYATLTGRWRLIVKVPVLSPRLSSLVAGDDRIRSLLPFALLGYDDAVVLCLAP